MLQEMLITFAELNQRRTEILADVAEHGTVYLVTADVGETKGIPSGMVLDDRQIGFVLGPEAICGRVLGLVDEEYGWPAFYEAKKLKSTWDLVPKHRHHPVIRVGTKEVYSVMHSEYLYIRRSLETG